MLIWTPDRPRNIEYIPTTAKSEFLTAFSGLVLPVILYIVLRFL